jgi:hypothetical protein
VRGRLRRGAPDQAGPDELALAIVPDDRPFMNVRDIVSGLRRAFDAFTQRLRDDPELRDRSWQRSQRARTLDGRDPRETEAWRRLLPGPRAGSR